MKLYKRQDGEAFIKRYHDGSLTDKAAFPCGSVITIEFHIKEHFSPSTVWFYMGNDKEVFLSRELRREHSDGEYAVYIVSIDSAAITGQERRGLFFYHFEAETSGGRLYTKTDGVNCMLADYFRNEWQILIYNEEYTAPSWLNGGVFYQIFPDRFAKGEMDSKRDNAVYNEDWDNGIPEFPERTGDDYPNNTFFGGTLTAAAEKMEYLADLGVTCIYLNPVFEAFSNHKYDIGDYMKVDDMFGGEKALELFIKKAEEKGIKVILDGVFNHVGADSIYFNKYGKYKTVGAYQSKESPYYDWFSFGSYPERYDSWWGLRNLPKIKRNESYDSFVCDKVIPKYMDMGVYGWRLDVADELDGGFLERVVKAVKENKEDALLVGEVWEDASNKIAYEERKRYFQGRQLDSVSNYPIRNSIIDYMLNRDSSLLKLTLQTLYEHYPAHKLAHIMNIAGTHDTERILTVLSGEVAGGRSNAELSKCRLSKEKRRIAVERLKHTYLLLSFMPGVPCIYYGDEVGMEGWQDPFNRGPFPWNNIDREIYAWFAKINKLRADEILFQSDKLRIYETGTESFVAERYNENESILLCSNMSEKETKICKYEKMVDNCDENMYNHFISMPAFSVRVYKKADGVWKLLI